MPRDDSPRFVRLLPWQIVVHPEAPTIHIPRLPAPPRTGSIIEKTDWQVLQEAAKARRAEWRKGGFLGA